VVVKDRELSGLYAFLTKPLFFRARFVLALLVVPLVLSFTQPLWRVQFYSAQYPDGLTLDVYAHTIEGGRGGADLREINILNHTIGMRALDRHDLSDLDWLPFAIGLVALLALRSAAIGDVRSLVDVVAVTFYVVAFAALRFTYRLHSYGHSLDPDAPVKVPPFSPAMFGNQQIGDVSTFAGPRAGMLLIALFSVGALALLVVHLVAGRREHAKERAA